MAMTNVDMSVFKEIQTVSGTDEGMSNVIYGLAGGDLDFIPYEGEFSSDDLKANYGYEWIEGDTGGEGEGEYCYGVFKLQDKIYKAEWSYYSHYGCDYEDIESTLKEVKPVEKLVTVYE